LTFELLASDWGDDGEMTADPTAEYSFVYDGFKLLVGGADESVPVVNNTVDLSGNTGEYDNELRFYTEGDSNGTGALTATLDLTLGTDYEASNVTPVPDGDPVVTYSIGKVRQYYKITLPKTTYPVEGTLTIKDGETQLEQVLAITSVPVYENTVKPVLVEGNYWAPVNVGATLTTYSPTLASCGYVYQWGRNVPFVYDSANDLQPGPVTAEAASGIYKDLFITSATDWLIESDDDLWSGANAQGPCPAGWRVPTETELGVLKGLSVAVTNGRKITISGKDLFLPAAGYRGTNGTTTTWYLQGQYGGYWSSTAVTGEASAMKYGFNGTTTVDLSALARANGHSVRCIQK
jgi:uncharacterized protein (TIGR02145 family)